MHASVVIPWRVDFTIFKCFLKGYDVGETVDFLMNQATQEKTVEMAPSSRSSTPVSSPRDVDEAEESPLPVRLPSLPSYGSDVVDREFSSLNKVFGIMDVNDTKNERPRSYDASCFQSHLLLEEVEECFRNFRTFVQKDNFLRTPSAFLTTHTVLLSYSDRRKMVNMYYEYEPEVMRFFLGYKNARASVESMLSDLKYSSSKGIHSSTSEFSQRLRFEVCQIDESVVRRQLENVKLVCSTIAPLYRGKGERSIPRDVPLQMTVERFFGLQRPLSIHYGVALFCYEHNLNTKFLERFKTCEDCFTLCSLLAAYCCDASGLLVGESKGVQFKTVSRQLEDARWLGDLHMEVFGESFKPRWQQQLDDGVQRVMGSANTTMGSEKVSPATQNAGVTDGNLNGSPSSAFSLATSPHEAVGSGTSSMGLAFPLASPSLGVGTGDGINSFSSPSGLSGFPASMTSFPWHSPTNGPHPSLCANSRFTKRFCLEFGLLMKAIAKISFLLSGGHLNDALECFATRVLHPLEQLSVRDMPLVDAGAGGASQGMHSSLNIAASLPSVPGSIATEDNLSGSKTSRSFAPKGTDSSSLLASGDRMDSAAKKRSATGKAAGGGGGEKKGEDLTASDVVPTLGGDAKMEGTPNPSLSVLSNPAATFSVRGVTTNGNAKDKMYVVELCAFLGVLSKVWTVVTPAYDAEEKEAFLSLVHLLRSLTSLIISFETA